MTDPFRRQILLHDIQARTKGFELDVAGPGDFAAGPPRGQDRLESLHGLLPYCVDVAQERLIYTRTPDMAAVLDAPFLYQGQYRAADHLVSVPLERLPGLERGKDMAPTFVLSVSRCGSTLLSMLLRHARQPTASEPDLYTQVAMLQPDQRARLGEAGLRVLLRGGTAALARQLGARVAIKLRDHCNDIAVLLAEAVPQARMAFMLRGHLGWASSRHRAFNDPPQALADILKRGVLTYDALVRGGHAPLLVWYEDLVHDPDATLRRFGVPQAALDDAGLQSVMHHDAQAGTSLAQHATGARPMPDAVLQEFAAIWARIAPRAMLLAHGLERLLPS